MSSNVHITSKLYDGIAQIEDMRLKVHPLEKLITLDTISHHTAFLNERSLKIADIGGATGAYAFDLTSKGHQVHLRDLSPGLLDIAREKQASASSPLASIEIADAKDEDFLFPTSERATFDVVLLLGPLYHLLHYEERLSAIRNALNLLHSDGVAFITFVSMNAHLRDIAMREPDRLITQFNFYQKYMETGQYVRTDGDKSAQSYHSRLEEIHPLIEQAGGRLLEIVGVEGILGGGLDKMIANRPQEVIEAWSSLLSKLGRARENLGNSDHWAVISKSSSSSSSSS